MNFQAIVQKNSLKTYAVLLCYVAIFLFIGLLVDIVRKVLSVDSTCF